MARSPSNGSHRSTKSSRQRKSHHASIPQEGLDDVKISDLASDESLSRNRPEGVAFDLPLVESPAVDDTTQILAEADTSAPPMASTTVRQYIASQTAPRFLPIRQGPSAHMGFAQHPDTPAYETSRSTAQALRTPPYGKPVPSNSWRIIELSSPDVRYSTDEHHGSDIL